MSLLNPTPEELDDLMTRIANGLPGHALDAHAALASLRTAMVQRTESLDVLDKRVRHLERYKNSIRSVDLEFDETPGVAAPTAPSSPPRLSLVPWADEPGHVS